MGRTLGKKARVRVKKTKIAKKQLTKVVKAIVNKGAETKFYAQNWSYQYLNGAMRVCNLTNAITQGVSTSNRIGDKIYIKGVSLKMVHSNIIVVPTAIHYAFIASDEEITGFNTTATPSDYIRSGSADSDLWRLDKDKIQIMKRGVSRIKDAAANNTNEKKSFRNIYCKFNKSYQYNPATGYGRLKNYYLLTWANVSGGGLATANGTFDLVVYFTDV